MSFFLNIKGKSGWQLVKDPFDYFDQIIGKLDQDDHLINRFLSSCLL